MKSRKDISIAYLYEQNPHKFSLYDGDKKMFELKFIKEQEDVETFCNTATLEDLIFLFVRLYKDRYPNGNEITTPLSQIGDRVEKENSAIYYALPESRNDIKQFEWHYFLNNKFGASFYLQKAVFHFAATENKEHLITAIKEALEGKVYTETNGFFEVADSPIKQITVTNHLFELLVNPDKVVYYF
jgi:hypothetical protein